MRFLVGPQLGPSYDVWVAIDVKGTRMLAKPIEFDFQESDPGSAPPPPTFSLDAVLNKYNPPFKEFLESMNFAVLPRREHEELQRLAVAEAGRNEAQKAHIDSLNHISTELLKKINGFK